MTGITFFTYHHPDSSHLRSNGLPGETELEQPTPAAEDYSSLEPAGHVTSSTGDQAGGEPGSLGTQERYSPPELHKDDNKSE